MSIRAKLLRVGTTGFWSRVGAVLGLLATLWATLVGKTLPELLASAEPPIVHFQQAADRVCTRLPVAIGTPPDLAVIASTNVNSATPILPAKYLFALDQEFINKVAGPINELTPDLFAIEIPPPQYSSEFKRFEQHWTSTARRLYSLALMIEADLYSLYLVHYNQLRPILPPSRSHDYRRVLKAILGQAEATIMSARSLGEDATIINAAGCQAVVVWIEHEAEGLGRRLLGEPAAL